MIDVDAIRSARSWTRRGSLLAAVGGVVGLTTAAARALDQKAAAGRAGHRGASTSSGTRWAAGLHADPANALGQVAARAIGWPITVDAISGTGYLNDAGQRTYVQRAGRAPTGTERLVIVQGGSNDDDQDLAKLGAAVDATIRTLQHRFPDARILLLGPGRIPPRSPTGSGPSTRSSRRRRSTPASPGSRCSTSTGSRRIGVDAVIDPGNHHPTVSGQQYLGLRLAAAIRILGAGPPRHLTDSADPPRPL